MIVIPHLIKAIPLIGYKIFVEFADGVKGEINLKKWKGKGVFVYWNDENNFQDFCITNNK